MWYFWGVECLEHKLAKNMLSTQDKRAYLTHNQYVSYAHLSWAGSMYFSKFVLQALKMIIFVTNVTHMWPNPTKPVTSRKTCYWVHIRKRWLAQNYFQIFKFVFSCLLSGEQCILSNAWKNPFKWDFFQTINDGLSLLIPIHSCSKWKTNWPISKKWWSKNTLMPLKKSAISWEMFMLQTWSWCHFKA